MWWNIHRVWIRKREGRKALAKPRRRWENNIEMGLDVIGRGLD
jgi:hypothetical protein